MLRKEAEAAGDKKALNRIQESQGRLAIKDAGSAAPWSMIEATWGEWGKDDQAKRIDEHVNFQQGKLWIEPTVRALGDPHPGKHKRIRLVMSNGSTQLVIHVPGAPSKIGNFELEIFEAASDGSTRLAHATPGNSIFPKEKASASKPVGTGFADNQAAIRGIVVLDTDAGFVGQAMDIIGTANPRDKSKTKFEHEVGEEMQRSLQEAVRAV